MVSALTSPLSSIKDWAKYITSLLTPLTLVLRDEVKTGTTLTSPLTRVKDKVNGVVAVTTTTTTTFIIYSAPFLINNQKGITIITSL